jgi:cyclophilin family peptidyl-prolyl cis-trans isomerase
MEKSNYRNNKGNIELALFEKEAPNTVANLKNWLTRVSTMD